jgi:hypothetical protein
MVTVHYRTRSPATTSYNSASPSALSTTVNPMLPRAGPTPGAAFVGDGFAVAVLLVPVPEFVGVGVAVDEFPTRASSRGSETTAAVAVPFTQSVKLVLVPETKLTIAHCKERSQELAAKPGELPQEVCAGGATSAYLVQQTVGGIRNNTEHALFANPRLGSCNSLLAEFTDAALLDDVTKLGPIAAGCLIERSAEEPGRLGVEQVHADWLTTDVEVGKGVLVTEAGGKAAAWAVGFFVVVEADRGRCGELEVRASYRQQRESCASN